MKQSKIPPGWKEGKALPDLSHFDPARRTSGHLLKQASCNLLKKVAAFFYDEINHAGTEVKTALTGEKIAPCFPEKVPENVPVVVEGDFRG